uniref:Uncharacterized protein n=1 Tax=Avena sativa TaxID=4498 RepID=A0ACD6AMG3_AVESA
MDMPPENTSSETRKNLTYEVDEEFYPLVRRYKDGRIERFFSSFVPACEDQATNRGVATRDVVIDQDTGVSARLFLPSSSSSQAAAAAAAATATGGTGKRRLPLVLYVHGGSFCTDSAFSRTYHRYVSSLAASCGALVVSVEYRLAPEYPIPTAYDDTWVALRWMASLSDPWLANYADPEQTFLAGDSAGANIAYNMAVRAAQDHHMMDIEGLIMVHPFFWGVHRLPSEEKHQASSGEESLLFPPVWVDRLWPFVTAGMAGNDDPLIDPSDEDMSCVTCRRVLVAVAEKDTFRERGCQFASRLRDNGMVQDEVTVVESEGEDHGFHLFRPLRATSKNLMKRIVQFINQPGPTPSSTTTVMPDQAGDCWSYRPMLGVPTRPFKDIFGYGMNMKRWSNNGSSVTTTNSLMVVGPRPKLSSPRIFSNPPAGAGPQRRYRGPFPIIIPGRDYVMKTLF